MAVIAFQPGPGAYVLAFWCDSPTEYDTYKSRVEDGTFTFDGQHVDRRLDDASDRAALFIRMRLAASYRTPTRRLHFEDVAYATRIVELGFYSFEGALHRAMKGDAPGVVLLDRIYHEGPPPQYHGRQLLDPPATIEREVP